MIVKTFIGRDKSRAIRKALDFWYRFYKDDVPMIKFFSRCTWKKKENNFFVIYRGPAPKDK